MTYQQALSFIRNRRKNELLTAEQLYIAALKSNEELHWLDIKIRAIELDDSSKDEETYAALSKQRDVILKESGIELDPTPHCKFCGDSGVYSGKICACAMNLCLSNNPLPASFDRSDFSAFAKDDLPSVRAAYEKSLAFVKKFHETNKINILLYGKTGTGKTFLASCIAGGITDKGYSAVFVTAFEFVNRMLAYHTAPVSEKLEHISPLLDCDLLAIDDLGTETILKNVTIEYLYNIINERMRYRRHTLITTNLDDNSLALRYGERIFSRLFDKRLSYGFALGDKDLRKS